MRKNSENNEFHLQKCSGASLYPSLKKYFPAIAIGGAISAISAAKITLDKAKIKKIEQYNSFFEEAFSSSFPEIKPFQNVDSNIKNNTKSPSNFFGVKVGLISNPFNLAKNIRYGQAKHIDLICICIQDLNKYKAHRNAKFFSGLKSDEIAMSATIDYIVFLLVLCLNIAPTQKEVNLLTGLESVCRKIASLPESNKRTQFFIPVIIQITQAIQHMKKLQEQNKYKDNLLEKKASCGKTINDLFRMMVSVICSGQDVRKIPDLISPELAIMKNKISQTSNVELFKGLTQIKPNEEVSFFPERLMYLAEKKISESFVKRKEHDTYSVKEEKFALMAETFIKNNREIKKEKKIYFSEIKKTHLVLVFFKNCASLCDILIDYEKFLGKLDQLTVLNGCTKTLSAYQDELFVEFDTLILKEINVRASLVNTWCCKFLKENSKNTIENELSDLNYAKIKSILKSFQNNYKIFVDKNNIFFNKVISKELELKSSELRSFLRNHIIWTMKYHKLKNANVEKINNENNVEFQFSKAPELVEISRLQQEKNSDRKVFSKMLADSKAEIKSTKDLYCSPLVQTTC